MVRKAAWDQNTFWLSSERRGPDYRALNVCQEDFLSAAVKKFADLGFSALGSRARRTGTET
jgi:hypothetical protein